MAEDCLSRHGEIAQLSPTEIAYIAGLIDADGTISSSRQRKPNGTYQMPKPLVLIVNGHFPMIEWLKLKVGAGCSYLTKTKPRREGQVSANWAPVHRYQLTGLKAIRLVEACMPHLLVKRERAELMVRLPMRGRDYAQFATDQMREDATCIADALRVLNVRGIGVRDG